MGQRLSCAASDVHGLFMAIQFGDVKTIKAVLESDPSLVKQTTLYNRHSALHVATTNGQIEIIRPLSHDQRRNRNDIVFFLLVSQQTEMEAVTNFSRYPGFNLTSIPDGLLENHPRLGDQLTEMFDALEAVTKSLFRETLVSGTWRPPVMCVIADGILGFMIDRCCEGDWDACYLLEDYKSLHRLDYLLPSQAN